MYICSGSPTSHQISQWLRCSPPWLLMSGPSSHFFYYSVYNLLLSEASVTAIVSKWLQDFKSLGNHCICTTYPCSWDRTCTYYIYKCMQFYMFLQIDLKHGSSSLCSFYTSSGTGFEAFFTSKMVLVVATVTKKEFITTSLKEFPLTTQEWVSNEESILSLSGD